MGKGSKGIGQKKVSLGNEWDTARCNLSGEPKPVGSLEANKSVYGCYDMAGSVHEWCADWYADSYYAESPTMNPKGPDRSVRKVIRGIAVFQTISGAIIHKEIRTTGTLQPGIRISLREGCEKIDLSAFIYSLSMALYLVRVGLGAEGVSTSHSAKLKIELGLWLLFV